MTQWGKWWLVMLVGVAAVLRFPGLFANSFHPDEALFASWARLIATWRDPLLQTQLVDKPPLLFYLQAAWYPLFGSVEWAARLPNFIASLVLIPLTGRLAWQLYQQELTAVLSAAFVTLSPLAIQFSSTAFIDPLLTALLVATLVAGNLSHSRPSPSKIQNPKSKIQNPAWLWFGLAAAAKYQAWLFLPLVVGLAVLRGWRPAEWRRWFLGLAAILVLLALWQVARAGRLDLWAAQMESFGGLRPAWSWELWPRLQAWARVWRYVFASPAVGFGLLLLSPLFLALLIHDRDRPTALDQLLALFLAAYILLHWLVAAPAWDRYVLPAVPILGLLLARLATRLLHLGQSTLEGAGIRGLGDLSWSLLLAGWLLLQTPAALQARLGAFPVGGRPTADDGAAHIAAFLADAPYGTVLYDHWYSWQWRYHLFDSRVYVSWFPHPAALAEDLGVFGGNGQPRYLVLPTSPAALPVEQAVVAAGFSLQPIPVDHPGNRPLSMQLYQIRPMNTDGQD
ncbi:MAG: glycosyltransferase family 39 protein [Chloroflexota bacterium]